MPLTKAEWEEKARIQGKAKAAGIPVALLTALEKSRPPRSNPQQVSSSLLGASQNLLKSFSKLFVSKSSSSTWKPDDHGVPTGLFRLPLEIREQIYGWVVGHHTVLNIPENYHQSRSSTGKSNRGSLALLQVCHQIYTEAIQDLYKSNTFHFQNHNDFLYFAHTINSTFLAQITSLSFDLNSILRVGGTPYDHQCSRFTIWWLTDTVQTEWSHVWSIIAVLENLTDLKVFIQDPGSPEWDGMQCLCTFEEHILWPLFRVKRELRVFGVDVPWVTVSSWARPPGTIHNVQGSRFSLIRRGIQMPR